VTKQVRDTWEELRSRGTVMSCVCQFAREEPGSFVRDRQRYLTPWKGDRSRRGERLGRCSPT
jgi:hypothetical protein